MPRPNPTAWRLDRRVNLSVVLQLMVLASLIVGTWVNLQSRLNLLQRDVTMLLDSQRDVRQELKLLSETSISHEYRLQRIEEETEKRKCL
ncbi:MAG: hypothetical protein JW741_27225 [Sedimentisphaerales bacterium]|nr:hypothetical protein [Sedimentisphaerales bacterium]